MEKYRVFVVEDDEDDWSFLKEAFEEVGCTSEVHHYQTPANLLKSLPNLSKDQHPDLIVLDHQTPGINGSEAVQLIRANKNFDHIALVVYSTTIPPYLQEKLMEQGVDLCLIKGSSTKDIYNHINEFCHVVERKWNSTAL